MKRRVLAALLGSSLAAICFAAPASAHISLEKGGTHLSRYGDANLKQAPCGTAGGARGTHVYTYEPGSTITVKLVETLAHPSYFRIAFDDDGDDGFKEPASIKPIDPNRACPDGPGDHCGASDFYNTPAVLPGMDNLNPHMPSGTPTYTWQVTFPNIECNNCTLQVIQVMEDDTFHGPYDPTPGVGVEDLYHQCIDIVLKKGASLPDSGVVNPDGGIVIEPDGGSSGGTSGGTSGTSGGTSGGSGGTSGTSGTGGTSGTSGHAAPGSSDGSGSTGGCTVSANPSTAGLSAASLFLAFGLLRLRRRRP